MNFLDKAHDEVAKDPPQLDESQKIAASESLAAITGQGGDQKGRLGKTSADKDRRRAGRNGASGRRDDKLPGPIAKQLVKNAFKKVWLNNGRAWEYFSPTWSCGSRKRNTTSSGWK